MDDFYKILITALLSIITMTSFSYLISKAFRELYKEPVLLTYFLNVMKIKISPGLQIFLAWMLHYLIGLGFVIVYHLIWQAHLLPLNWQVGFLIGFVSGIIGIIGWVLIFNYTDHQPKIDFKGYYLQLLFAHIIFGCTAYVAYRYL